MCRFSFKHRFLSSSTHAENAQDLRYFLQPFDRCVPCGFLITCLALPRPYPPALLQMLLGFRCVVGLGLGGVHVPFALFMEFVPASHRGFWLSVLQFFWTIGALFEAGLAWVVMPWKGWRALLALSAVPLRKRWAGGVPRHRKLPAKQA